jgi:hypothetical protein
MRRAARALATLAATLVAGSTLATAAASAAEPEPAWAIHSVAVPTNFVPGDNANDYFYEVTVANSAAAATDGSPIVLTDTLPAGLTVRKVDLLVRSVKEGSEVGGVFNYGETACATATTGGVATVTCQVTEALPQAVEPTVLHPSEEIRMVVHVSIPPAATGQLENLVEVAGGGASAATASSQNQASAEPAHAGFSEFHAVLLGEDGKPVTQAGAHPYEYMTSFAVNTNAAPEGSLAPFVPADGDLKTISVALPPGLVGNPTVVAECTAEQFNERHSITLEDGSNVFQNGCPDGSAIGLVVVQQAEGIGQVLPLPLYNLVPPKGMPAQFGFQLAGAPIFIDTKVRTGSDYGITAFLPNTNEAKRVTAASVTIWGVPAASSHDRLRGRCLNSGGKFSLGECPAGLAESRPFLRLPTRCGTSLLTEMSFDTWTSPGQFLFAPLTTAAPDGCALLGFSPTIAATPQTSAADSPTGLAFNLHIDQDEVATDLAVADLRNVTVTLPAGVTVNPASAGGLASCSLEQIGLDDEAPATCPDASKIGSVEVKTPLLDHPVKGGVFLARQIQNPFGSLLAIYIAAFDPESGVVLKLAGEVEPDPETGQLTTRFLDNPQLPFEDLSVTFFDGPRAPLRTPPSCGDYTTTSALTSYSAPDSGPDATPTSSFQIDTGPAGPACPIGAVSARLSAGLANPTAGARSPFRLRLSREDGSDELSGVTVKLPPGLIASLKGVPYCPEQGIAAAAARTEPGDGGVERASPSCPVASRVGGALAGAGAGPSPFFTGGDVYLAGPYKGAPVSLVAMIPAIAGPFDLGVVVDRIALQVDQTSAQVTSEADPFPRVRHGIVLDVRDIRVELDRPNFTLAPTSCEPKSIDATVQGFGGGSVAASTPFQVGRCGALGFSPTLSLSLKGPTRRPGHPSLRAELRTVPGQANVARTTVTLPPTEQIDNAHISNPCTRPRFAAGECPPGSVLGRAKAFSPLLDQPLEGLVYFRANGGERELPDIVADLRGQIHIVLVGFVDSVGASLRTRFESVPDAAVDRFVLELFGGKRGLLVNNRNLCARRYRAKVQMDAQNGRVRDLEPVIKTSCAKSKKRRVRRR